MDFKTWLENEEQNDDGKYWIRSSDLVVMKAKLEKLNRRAAKLNMPPVAMNLLAKKVMKDAGPDGKSHDVEMTQVELVGTAPKIKGWTFSARIVHGETGNMLFGVPGEEVPVKYRTSPPECDHCRSSRKRKDTFIIKSDAGEYKQIGTNCLRDFLGTDDPSAYVLYFSELKQFVDDMDEGFGGARRSEEIETVDFVSTALAAIRKYGFVSRKVAEERGVPTTASEASRYYFDTTSKDAEKYRKAIDEARRPDDRERAEKMVAWARSLKNGGEEAVEDYLWNLSVAAERLTVDAKSAGLMASLPTAYNRANGTSETRQATDRPTPPNPTLKAGDKFEGVLTVEKVRSWSTDYGVTTLHIMKDEQGQTYKWKASRESLDEGSKVKIKGTVKTVEPDKYNNNIPTVELTRCKVLGMVVGKEEQDLIAKKEGLEKEWKSHFEDLPPFNSYSNRPYDDAEVEQYCMRSIGTKMLEGGLDQDLRRTHEANGRGLDYERFKQMFLDEWERDPAKTATKYGLPQAAQIAIARSAPACQRMKEIARELWQIHVAESRHKGREVHKEHTLAALWLRGKVHL